MKFTIKNVLFVTLIVAMLFAAYTNLDRAEKIRIRNIRLASEFMKTHGEWTYTKGGNRWNLSGITDIKVEELSLLANLYESDRGRIVEIDFSDSNVSDEHLEFIQFLPSIERLDLRNTNVTEAGVTKILEFPRYQQPVITHSLENGG